MKVAGYLKCGAISLCGRFSQGLRSLSLLRGRHSNRALRTTQWSGVKPRWLLAIPTEVLPIMALPAGYRSAQVRVSGVPIYEESKGKEGKKGERNKETGTNHRVMRKAERGPAVWMFRIHPAWQNSILSPTSICSQYKKNQYDNNNENWASPRGKTDQRSLLILCEQV